MTRRAYIYGIGAGIYGADGYFGIARRRQQFDFSYCGLILHIGGLLT